MEKKYNVYIVDREDTAVSRIGENIRESKVDMRVMMGLSRIDRDNFFIADDEVGSEADMKHAGQLSPVK